MKSGFVTRSLLALLLSTIVAQAQVSVDVSKITCRQFLTGRMLPTASMALWFNGYYNGKRGATVIEASAIRPNARKVEDYCGLHQDDTVMKAVETVFGFK
jgi:acid stress chaperone HdeB